MALDKSLHHFNAAGVVEYNKFYTTGTKILLWALKSLIFSYHNGPDIIEKSCSTAHITRRKGGIERGSFILCFLKPTGILDRIHFSMEDSTALLQTLVVPFSHNLTFNYQNGTDWDTPTLLPLFRLFKGRFKMGIRFRVHWLLAASFAIRRRSVLTCIGVSMPLTWNVGVPTLHGTKIELKSNSITGRNGALIIGRTKGNGLFTDAAFGPEGISVHS